MAKSMINENRFFLLISAFFAHPEKVLVEIAQNASRAKATKLDIKITENSLTVKDNGQGTENIIPLLRVADSQWSKDVEEQEMPAGWGNYYLIALSKTITYKSLFGSITIDCPRFLKDSDYRKGIFTNIIPSDKQKGFTVKSVLLPDIGKKLLLDAERDWSFQDFYGKTLGYFPMDITVNGKLIKRKSLIDNIKKCHIQTVYQGNHIGINISKGILESPNRLLMDISAVWYGIPIKNMCSPSVFLDVTEGSPITPVLPFRHDIKDDEKIAALYKFVKNEVIKHCIELLNNSGCKDKNILDDASEILSLYGSQDALDNLSRFCITTTEPYHSIDRYSDSSLNIIVVDKHAPVVVSEGVNFYIDGKEQDVDDLFLPKNAIVAAKIPNKKPSWLSIEHKDYALYVKTAPKSNGNYSGFYKWEKSIITCNGKDIKSLAVVFGAGDGCIYYSEDPNSVYDMSNIIFAQREYYEDGGNWDSQRDDFDREISEDIQNITGTYNIGDLFKGIYDVLGIWHSEVVSLNFNKKKKTLIIKTTSKEKVLKVA